MPPLPSASSSRPGTLPGKPPRPSLRAACRAVTLVEVMISLVILAIVMLGFIGTFIQSRRSTEANVLQAAGTSLVYGIVEQIKQLDYTTMLPNYEVDPDAPATDPDGNTVAPPYVRVRLNQDRVVWLRAVHSTDPATPLAPTTTPAPTATAASLGALDNRLGSIPLSELTGTASQEINMNIWVWIDEIPDIGRDVSDVKKITVVYTYTFVDGATTKIVRDREVFLRTRYDQ